jgi:hypothetical protein
MASETDSTSIRRRAKGVLVALLAAGALGGGCAYSGITSTPDGTIVLARNSLMGANRKVFVCHVAGSDLKCTESASPP